MADVARTTSGQRTRIGQRRRLRCSVRPIAFVAAVLSLAIGPLATAQQVIINGNFVVNAWNGAVVGPEAKFIPSFTLPAQATDLKDSTDEFKRYVAHESWDRAFKSLETIADKTATGFIDRGDGVLVPSRLLVRSLLASLPAGGKSAYRVFFDPQAMALWNAAQGRAEAENLSKIVENHLISSVGDRAADRLGDLYYEQGSLEQALGAWRSILAFCPESKLSQPQIYIKMATALARLGRWAEFRDIEKLVQDRYAGQTVEIGGRRMAAEREIGRLAAAGSASPSDVAGAPSDDIALPDGDEPLWQFRYQSKADPANPNAPFTLIDVFGRTRANDFPIPAAVDADRVYLNLFGIDHGFDLHTGKLLWRSGKLHQLQLQQNRQGIMPERYSMRLAGDRLWCVTRDPQQANQQPMTAFSLVARDPATGNEAFNSRRSLSTWNVLGAPYIVGDTIYLGASRSNQGRELYVLALNAKDGRLLYSLNIGSYAVDQNQVYTERVAEPTFAMHRDRLFVETNGGAIVVIEPQSRSVEWAVLYETLAPQQGYYDQFNLMPQYGVAAPLFAAGLLFSKGMRSTRLVGLQIDAQKAIWNRPVLSSAVVLGADSERIYLGGGELTAYDLKTQELIWSAQLPRSAAWSVPLITRNRLYQFTSRGVCELDKCGGHLLKIFRGIDLDSYGGAIFVTPEALVTVSNLAITAYPLAEHRSGEERPHDKVAIP